MRRGLSYRRIVGSAGVVCVGAHRALLDPEHAGCWQGRCRWLKNALTRWPLERLHVEVKRIASTRMSSAWPPFRQLARVCFLAASTSPPTSTSSPLKS